MDDAHFAAPPATGCNTRPCHSPSIPVLLTPLPQELEESVVVHAVCAAGSAYPDAPLRLAVVCAALEPAVRLWLTQHLLRHAAR